MKNPSNLSTDNLSYGKAGAFKKILHDMPTEQNPTLIWMARVMK
jgi:hypothetical protein